jgi:hypothetical protein
VSTYTPPPLLVQPLHVDPVGPWQMLWSWGPTNRKQRVESAWGAGALTLVIMRSLDMQP